MATTCKNDITQLQIMTNGCMYSQIGWFDNTRCLVVLKIVITCVLNLQIGNVTSCQFYNI